MDAERAIKKTHTQRAAFVFIRSVIPFACLFICSTLHFTERGGNRDLKQPLPDGFQIDVATFLLCERVEM